MNLHFEAALLAGGYSRRMGRDKSQLLWHGERLLDRQVNTLRALEPQRLLLSSRPGQNISCPQATLVEDREEGAGPLGGLISCLEVIQSPFLLILAIDMPAMPAAYLRHLLNQVRETCGLVPVMQGGLLEPLAAVYPRALLSLALDQVHHGDGSLHGLVHRAMEGGLLKTMAVTEEERAYFLNLNHPSDLPPG